MMKAGVTGKVIDAGLTAMYFTAGAWLTSHEKTVHDFLVDAPQECVAYTSASRTTILEDASSDGGVRPGPRCKSSSSRRAASKCAKCRGTCFRRRGCTHPLTAWRGGCPRRRVPLHAGANFPGSTEPSGQRDAVDQLCELAKGGCLLLHHLVGLHLSATYCASASRWPLWAPLTLRSCPCTWAFCF